MRQSSVDIDIWAGVFCVCVITLSIAACIVLAVVHGGGGEDPPPSCKNHGGAERFIEATDPNAGGGASNDHLLCRDGTLLEVGP